MKRLILFILAFLPLALCAAERVTIVIGASAPELEKRAAGELAGALQKLFNAQTTVQNALPESGAAILVGSPATNAAVKTALGAQWPALSAQGHVLKSVASPRGAMLVAGGGSPVASLWAVHELGYRFGIRHLLHGDFMPLEKPAFTLEGFDVVLEPRVKERAWSGFLGRPFGAEAWSIDEQKRLLGQLAKLKFTHFVIPAKVTPFAAIRVDGDTPGRKAFKGAKEFANADLASDYIKRLKAAAAEAGIETRTAAASAAMSSLLPHFQIESLADVVVTPGDANASAHFLSRSSFAADLTAERALSDLATPICGKEVDERLLKGFGAVATAASLIATNDPALAVPDARMIARQLESSEAPPAWWTQAKDLYTSAMNEMYRANTRARDGARPFTLYHAKRFEFAVHFLTSIEAARKAGNAKAQGDKDAQLAALEAAVEGMYNALNALADVARDPSDRGAIAVLNEHGYRPLIRALEAGAN
ncbi:MAG: hypothetical protein ABMA13_15975 [Chthoniobacteraceae bacterium]